MYAEMLTCHCFKFKEQYRNSCAAIFWMWETFVMFIVYHNSRLRSVMLGACIITVHMIIYLYYYYHINIVINNTITSIFVVPSDWTSLVSVTNRRQRYRRIHQMVNIISTCVIVMFVMKLQTFYATVLLCYFIVIFWKYSTFIIIICFKQYAFISNPELRI